MELGCSLGDPRAENLAFHQGVSEYELIHSSIQTIITELSSYVPGIVGLGVYH